MDDAEIRLRCIEAAAKFPAVHPNGPAAGALETAQLWAEWVAGAKVPDPRTLHLKKK